MACCFISPVSRRLCVVLRCKRIPRDACDIRVIPDGVAAFFAICIGIVGGAKGANRICQVPDDIVTGPCGDGEEALTPQRTGGKGVNASEHRVVVEHFLEVGREPMPVCGIAVKTAADMVMDAAAGNLVEGVFEQRGDGFRMRWQHRCQQAQGVVWREFWRAAEAAEVWVEALG